jgi:hypothetical protein
VRTGKRIVALKMALDSIEHVLEVPVDMARFAFSSVRAPRKLSAVGILVAVCADVEF